MKRIIRTKPAATHTQIEYDSITNPADPEVEFPERLREARKQEIRDIWATVVLILALSSPLWVFLIFKFLEQVNGF